MIGREGMLGVELALGMTSAALQSTVRIEGWAWRMAAGTFRDQLAASPSLKPVLDLYLGVLLAQLATSATCLRHHKIEPRLARWLLMNQDRAGSSRLSITQDLLGTLLGVRRVSITNAASHLQFQQLIEYNRGELQILNRAGLKATACACYQTDQKSYAKIMHESSADH